MAAAPPSFEARGARAHCSAAAALRGPLVALAGLLAIALPAAAQTTNRSDLAVELVTGGLSTPTSMAFIGPDDILVLQKNDGRVRRIVNGVLQTTAVLDVAVHFSSERGLLGIATDPDFLNNRRIYLYYTESPTGADTGSSTVAPLGNRVYRYIWNGSAFVDAALILDLPATPGPNHDGGVIAFGPDDALYAVIGDLNRNGKLQNFPSGPDPDDTGVVFRVGALGQALPDSPFFDPLEPLARLGRYYAYGVRNSFGLAFDPLTGDLWDTENGPDRMDEVNRVVPGFNSGWERIMGPDTEDPPGAEDLWAAPGSVYRDPELSWSLPVAPAGLGFVRSPRLACDLTHTLLVGDNNCGNIYLLRLNEIRDGLALPPSLQNDRVVNNTTATRCAGEAADILLGAAFGPVTDVETGPDGLLYLVSLGRGAIYRLGRKAPADDDIDGDLVGEACDCALLDPTVYSETVEVPRLRIGGAAPTTLGWDSQTAAAGEGTTSDLVSGDVAALRADGGFASACTLAGAAARPALADPRPNPPPGAAYYYLVRAGNACGDGSYGDGTAAPDARDALDASFPPRCL